MHRFGARGAVSSAATGISAALQQTRDSGWSFFREAFLGRSNESAEKRQAFSREWIASVRAKDPQWHTAFAETITEELAAEGQHAGKSLSSGSATSSRSAKTAENESKGVSRFALAVSDDVAVEGFASRHGVQTGLVHSVSDQDHPMIGWLRSRGAMVIGKLRTVVPFALHETVHFERFPAARALLSGACDVALVTSTFGVAGSNGPVLAPVVSFTPSPTTFPRGSPPFSRKRSMALVMRDIQSLASFWAEISGQAQPAETVKAVPDKKHGPEEDGEEDAAAITRRRQEAQRAAAEHQLSGISTTGDKGGLIVGVPVDWIAACFANGGEDAGTRFFESYKLFSEMKMQDRSQGYNNRIIEVRKISWSASPDEVLNCAKTIAHYELAEALQRTKALDGTGLLDDLPAGLVSSIFEGKNTSEQTYTDALSVRNELARDFLEEAGVADCVVVPIASPPYQSHNLRSVVTTLPIALSFCPALSMRVVLPGFTDLEGNRNHDFIRPADGSTNETAIMIASEPGMDSALIDIVKYYFR
jgi:hypothetical protein